MSSNTAINNRRFGTKDQFGHTENLVYWSNAREPLGYVTCVFCDLTTDTQSIVNSLTDFAIYVVTENVTASSVADPWSDTVVARQ
jgi:hypothetical protein